MIIILEINKIYNQDCLEGMKYINDKSIDMILCDLPYGVLNKRNKWDSQIPFEDLWVHYKRIIKENGAIVLFGQGMFTANCMKSNEDWWKYNLIWKKSERTSGFLNANKMPMRNHEDIMVFYNKQPTYNPQFTYGHKPAHKRGKSGTLIEKNNCYGDYVTFETRNYEDGRRFPKSVIDIDREHPTKHPTQKPVLLCEWLIKTYTNGGELVLDNCIGSGSTALACINTNRNYIGFENDYKWFELANQRIKEVLSK